MDKAKQLLDRYDEETARWLYNRTLFEFKVAGDSFMAMKVLKQAVKNKSVRSTLFVREKAAA